MDSGDMQDTKVKPELLQSSDGAAESREEKSIPIQILDSGFSKEPKQDIMENLDENEIDKLYQENKHFLSSIGTPIDDAMNNIDSDNDECQIEKLYKENKDFLNNMSCNESDFLDELPNKELVEMNEQVDSYMLQEKVYDKLLDNVNQDFDDQSLISTDMRTDIGSVRGFLGNKVNQRHYYMLIQNNNTLINDAQQFRKRLVEKLTAIESQIQELKNSNTNNTSKSTFVKRFFTYRKEYFIDEDVFPCPGNIDKRKIERMNVIPTYAPHGSKWMMSHMEKLKKEVASHIMLKKTGKLKRLKSEISRSRPTPKMLEDYSKCEKELEILKDQPEDNIPLLVKDISIDWEHIVTKIRPESNESTNKMEDDCRKMWELCLAPSVNQKPWSDEEHKKLERLAVKKRKEGWDSIAKQLGTQRTGFQCFTHYQMKKPQDCGIPWSKQEDVLLLSYIHKHKNTSLKNSILMAISLVLRKRSFGEIRRRLSQLRDSTKSSMTIRKGPFTECEVKVMETCLKQGLNFKTIANLLGNRTHEQVRSKLSRKYDDHLPEHRKRKGLFTPDEDRRLMQLTVQHGITSWSLIAKKIKTRDRTQCRHRYNCIIANLKRGSDFKTKFRKGEDTASQGSADSTAVAGPAASTDACDSKEGLSIDMMLKTIKYKRKKPFRTPRQKKPSEEKHKRFQLHTDVDNLIQDYFAYAIHIPRCTQVAIKPDVMEKNFTGDGLKAALNYLQVEPDPDLLVKQGDVTPTEVSEYWNLADYPPMVSWYKRYVEEQKQMRRLNTGEPSVCEDIDLELPFGNLSNRYSMSSLLQSDLAFYKSNLVRAPIPSRSTHARLVINESGATTCNTLDTTSQGDTRARYYFPPSASTLRALHNYKKFQENSVTKDEVWFDHHTDPHFKNTEEGNAAKMLFQNRMQSLFTASYQLVQPISQETNIPILDWLLDEDEE